MLCYPSKVMPWLKKIDAVGGMLAAVEIADIDSLLLDSLSFFLSNYNNREKCEYLNRNFVISVLCSIFLCKSIIFVTIFSVWLSLCVPLYVDRTFPNVVLSRYLKIIPINSNSLEIQHNICSQCVLIFSQNFHLFLFIYNLFVM